MIKKYSWSIFIGVAMAAIVWALYINFFKAKKDPNRIYLESRAIEVKDGWGYEILTDGKVYIHQEFMPAVAGRHAFKSKVNALKTANLVLERLKLKQLPTITSADLISLDVIGDTSLNKQ